MKDKLKEIIPIFILVYCLIIVPIILYYYSIYLNKPSGDAWDQVKEYLVDSGEYSNEPIVFSPGWLKGYAADWGRLQKFNIAKKNNNFYVYWLITNNNKSMPEHYQTLQEKEIDNLFIVKLRKPFK